jgi:hypothetical protein
VLPAGAVQVAQGLLQALGWRLGQPRLARLRPRQLAALAGVRRTFGVVLSSSRPTLLEGSIPHGPAGTGHELGVGRLLRAEFQAIAATDQHQLSPCRPMFHLVLANGAPQPVVAKFLFMGD